ncbi:MAG: hypothetical protein KGR26_07600 [Cyanobacteria bacterium REEB65]|nr:hypothetical protein [Cyanobacteria bacterium REEB65]
MPRPSGREPNSGVMRGVSTALRRDHLALSAFAAPSTNRLQTTRTAIGQVGLAIGTPANLSTSVNLLQQVNRYLRSGIMASVASSGSRVPAPTTHAPLVRSPHAALQQLGRLGSGLAIGGGLFGMATAVAEMRDGQTEQGAKDLAVSGLATSSGLTNLVPGIAPRLASLFGLAGPAAEGAASMSLAGPLGGTACILSGAFQLASSIGQHKVEPAAEGGATLLGGSLLFASAFATGTVIGAPAGAVLGAVGGLTLFGSALVQNRAAIEAGVRSLGQRGLSAIKASSL